MTVNGTRFPTAAFSLDDPPSIDLQLNQQAFRAGQTMILTATLHAGAPPQIVDAYIVIQLPTGQVFSIGPNGLPVPGIQAVARAFPSFSASGEVARYTFTGGELPGTYSWYAALTLTGTANLLGLVDQEPFTVEPGQCCRRSPDTPLASR
jgi:hypothetical protein